MANFESTQSLITKLSSDSDVLKIDVNSTLNKRYFREAIEKEDGVTGKANFEAETELEVVSAVPHIDASDESILLVSGSNRGKALIICNNLELPANPTKHERVIQQRRMETLPLAEKVLSDHFGFNVGFLCAHLFCIR